MPGILVGGYILHSLLSFVELLSFEAFVLSLSLVKERQLVIIYRVFRRMSCFSNKYIYSDHCHLADTPKIDSGGQQCLSISVTCWEFGPPSVYLIVRLLQYFDICDDSLPPVFPACLYPC